MKKRGDRNGGYSLVEILVSLAILMIIVVPLLHGFVTGTVMNSKSKKVLQATTAAKNVIEVLKSQSLSELLNTDVSVTQPDGSVTTEKLGEKQADGTYAFHFRNQTVDSRTFRVNAVLDPNTYKSADPVTDPSLNDLSSYAIYDMDSAYDAFFAQSATADTDTAALLGSGPTVADNMTRTYTIDISKKSASVYADLNCYYTYQGTTRYSVTNQRIYAGSSAAAKPHLRNIYLLFEPMYNSAANIRESIIVNNPDLYPVTVYLVKMENSGTTQANELTYRVSANITEGTRTDYLNADGTLKQVTAVRTNLTDSQLKLKYNGASATSIQSKSYSAGEVLGLKNLTEADPQNRIYSIKVEVYEQDDASNTKILTMDGTKEE